MALLLASCFLSCKYPHKEKYGMMFNAQRSQIGLPALNAKWTICNEGKDYKGNNYISWARPYEGKSTAEPSFFRKTVVFNADTILNEENEYVGNMPYKNIDGTFGEELFITYNFIDLQTKNDSQRKGWECAIKNQASSDHSEKGAISLEQADSILKKWQLNRFEEAGK